MFRLDWEDAVYDAVCDLAMCCRGDAQGIARDDLLNKAWADKLDPKQAAEFILKEVGL